MNNLAKLMAKQKWSKEDIKRLLPSDPSLETINKWLLENHPRDIPVNSLELLRYIAKYGKLE